MTKVKPDKTNDKPLGRPDKTPDEDSWPSRLLNLKLGDSESKSCRLQSNEATPDQVKLVSERVSGHMRKSIARAKAHLPKGTNVGFITETGSFMSVNRMVVVTCVVTRVV